MSNPLEYELSQRNENDNLKVCLLNLLIANQDFYDIIKNQRSKTTTLPIEWLTSEVEYNTAIWTQQWHALNAFLYIKLWFIASHKLKERESKTMGFAI